MLFIIRCISTSNAPNGSMPPLRYITLLLNHQGLIGICRGIWFVLTGLSNTGALNPNQLPVKLRGTEITNHIPTKASIVVNGTAPEDCSKTRKKLIMRKVKKTIDGTKRGVRKIFRFQDSPDQLLYMRAETYPPMNPRRV